MESTAGAEDSKLSKEELVKKCKMLLLIVQKSKHACSDLQNEVEVYKTKLEEYDTEKKGDKETIKTLQELVDSLTEQKLTYITDIDEANHKIKALTATCESYKNDEENLQTEIAKKTKQIGEFTNQLSSVDSEIISLKRQNQRLVDENEQLINQLSEMEQKIMEFNEIGLQQREQLRLLEETVNQGATNEEQESKQQTVIDDYKAKLKNITDLYESEKDKSDKFNTKLKSYREKILKCAACINQLKNSRYILSKTVKEYSESIPKWQNEIIKASKFLDGQLSDFQNEIKTLKERLATMEEEYKNIFDRNTDLLYDRKQLESKNLDLTKSLETLQAHSANNNTTELLLQIRSLESEKSMLVKEKMTAKDHAMDFESQVNNLTKVTDNLKTQRDSYKSQLDAAVEENNRLIRKNENVEEFNHIQNDMKILEEQFELLKKEYENVMDLNRLLKEEVSTLRTTIDQPYDGAGNLLELNNSLQADVVKLENKLSALKQENVMFSSEIKESRSRIKKYEALLTENEDSKLENYRKENAELLNEMKEINQVFKERGEKISKQEKAINEMERLIKTMENDRGRIIKDKDNLEEKCASLEKELGSVQLVTMKHSEDISQLLIGRDNASKMIMEKDSLIVSLKDEIEKLKQQQTSDLPNEDMSTSTISKAEEHSRMKDLDDTFEDKYSKLRLFALKLKKKLNETTNELQNIKKEKNNLETLLADNCINTDTKNIDEVDGPAGKETNVEQVNVSELQNKLKHVTSELEFANQLKVEIEKLKADFEAKEKQLSSEVDAHKATKDALDKAKKDVKKKSVLSLEMEDYERSMKELTTKMEEKKNKMVQLESTIDAQQGTITAMKTQIKLLEEQIKTDERQSRTIKEELQHATEESADKDNIISTKNEIIIKLERDLEDEKRKFEEINVEMTTLLGEKEKVVINLCEEKIELSNKVKKLEFKCVELEDKLKVMNIELEDLKTEYTSYKVRAQAVLRQNQTVDHSHEEQLKEESAALRVRADSLQQKLQVTLNEKDELQNLYETEKRRAVEFANDATRASQRTSRLQTDLAKLSAQLDDERIQHKTQVETITLGYKLQMSNLEAKFQKEADEFKKQQSARDIQGGSLQDRANRNLDTQSYLLPVLPKEEGSDGELDINVTMLPREEGEGSEAAPSPPLSKQYTSGGNRSPVPLERLLEEGVPEDEILDAASMALTPEQEISDLRRKLQAQLQRVKHVTVLLAESERECARHAQMNELLKAEVRRAQGTLERTRHAHNAEYIKNVTLKFVMLAPGDERCRLVPVLQKILTLNPDETRKLTAVAKGLDPNPSRGWGSYLPWPGGGK